MSYNYGIGNDPASIKTGELIDHCWDLGWDIVFHGPTPEYPNGYITNERLDGSVIEVLSVTVAESYTKINNRIEEFLRRIGN